MQTNRWLALGAMLPELFPIIASHIPLYARPSTLLSLALSNRRLKEIIIPRLLYRQVWLQGEGCAQRILGILMIHAESTNETAIQRGELPLGHYICHLFVSSELSKETRDSDSATDVVRQLSALIRLGGLPNLLSLGLHMNHGWYADVVTYEHTQGFGRLGHTFWSSLREKCPKLSEISVTGTIDTEGDRWFEDSGLFQFQGLKKLRIKYWRGDAVTLWTPTTLFDNLIAFSPYLHTLALHFPNEEMDVTANGGLFTRRFPYLRSLTLEGFIPGSPDATLGFWVCHPNLELVELSEEAWFKGFVAGLPKLKILRASFEDVRTLAPHLGDQLVNLTVIYSVNAQVPYLLRSVLSRGLQKLRSLGIHQQASNSATQIVREGSQWHEDMSGRVSRVSRRRAARHFDAEYIASLARGAPNLEELELLGICLSPTELIGSALSLFSNLKRLYIPGELNVSFIGRYPPFLLPDRTRSFLEEVRCIADACPSLDSITILTDTYQNMHLCAQIERNACGVSIMEKSGCGRVVGFEETFYPGFLSF